MSKSRLSSQWEISAPFKQLESIDISGELLHRGKLSWNRRVVAVTGGCLAMYKPDKVRVVDFWPCTNLIRYVQWMSGQVQTW